jgi:hypothetical protein
VFNLKPILCASLDYSNVEANEWSILTAGGPPRRFSSASIRFGAGKSEVSPILTL